MTSMIAVSFRIPRNLRIKSRLSDEQTAFFDNKAFIEQHDRHWQIEQYHRAVKQVCNIERFQVRSKGAIKNHLFAAICGFVQLQKLSFAAVINNCYSLQRNLFKDVIASLFVAAMLSLVLALICFICEIYLVTAYVRNRP